MGPKDGPEVNDLYFFQENTPGVDITTANAIFTDRNKQLSKDFQTQTSNQYKVNFLPVNFQDPVNTVNYIDNFIAKATNNRIQHFINYGKQFLSVS